VDECKPLPSASGRRIWRHVAASVRAPPLRDSRLNTSPKCKGLTQLYFLSWHLIMFEVCLWDRTLVAQEFQGQTAHSANWEYLDKALLLNLRIVELCQWDNLRSGFRDKRVMKWRLGTAVRCGPCLAGILVQQVDVAALILEGAVEGGDARVADGRAARPRKLT